MLIFFQGWNKTNFCMKKIHVLFIQVLFFSYIIFCIKKYMFVNTILSCEFSFFRVVIFMETSNVLLIIPSWWLVLFRTLYGEKGLSKWVCWYLFRQVWSCAISVVRIGGLGPCKHAQLKFLLTCCFCMGYVWIGYKAEDV